MREAMETALQDRTAAPAELTVTWEEVCRYLDSLAAGAARRETIQVYRPKLEAFYHFLPEDKRGGCRHTGALARPPCCGKATRPVQPTPMCPPPMGCWPIWGGGICS